MLPNFLYIGPDKSGSTWIYQVLKSHPDVYVPNVKDIYYFDRYYDKGRDWYESFFSSVKNQKAVGELSHDYLYSIQAAHRIKQCIPGVRLITCLRDPVERAVSCYNYCIRLGLVTGDFAEAVERYPSIVNNSFYYTPLRRYFDEFDRSQIVILWYKDMVLQPKEFAKNLFRQLGVDDNIECSVIGTRVLGAGVPRNVTVARSAKFLAQALRRMGFTELVGHLKNNRLIQQSLYKAHPNGIKPSFKSEFTEKLRNLYHSDIIQLEKLLGEDLSEWYASRAANKCIESSYDTSYQ